MCLNINSRGILSSSYIIIQLVYLFSLHARQIQFLNNKYVKMQKKQKPAQSNNQQDSRMENQQVQGNLENTGQCRDNSSHEGKQQQMVDSPPQPLAWSSANAQAQSNDRMDEQPSNQPEPQNEDDWQSDHDDEISDQIQDEDEQQYEDDLNEGQQGDMDSDTEQLGTYKQTTINKLNLQVLPKEVRQIYEQLDSGNQKPLKKYIAVPRSEKIDKEVCAKIITSRDTVIQCFDCRMDQTCIICMQCFKNGNHEGHRYIVKKAGGGCCDCGDSEAWSEKGFCKQHSGKFKDFDIPEKTVSSFSRSVDGLMYLYFQLILTQDPNTQSYTSRLIEFLKSLNEQNLYFNKLTALCLTRPLPQPYSLNKQLDKRTILQNVLTSHISLKYFKHWFDLFISMFSYYPFKTDILKHYIQNYGLIVDGSKHSINNALSISCQIVTSFKVVEQYCVQNTIGIGQGSQVPTNARKLLKYYQMFSHDIGSFSNLSEKTPLLYWRMHINSHQSIKNIFQYYDILMKKAKKYQTKMSQTQLIARYIDFSEVQYKIVEDFTNILKVIQEESMLVEKVIHILWNKCSKLWKQNPGTLCILRPYERCLTLALFSYFGCSFENIQSRRQRLIKQVVKVSQSNFSAGCSFILNRMLETLFFYSKTQAQPGLGQTAYGYIYIYKIHSKILSMTDLLSVKIFLILLGTKHPLTFQSIIGLDRNKIVKADYLKQKSNYFANIIKVIRYLYTHFLPEIYVAYSINKNDISLYRKQIKQLLISFFIQNKNSVAQADLKKNFIQTIFPSEESKLIDAWIKQNCLLNKQTKTYKLDQQLLDSVQNMVGINYDDLWVSMSSKSPFGDIPKSLHFIRGHNIEVFNSLWNDITIQSLNSIVQLLFNKQDSKDLLVSILPILATLYLANRNNNLQGNFENLYKILEHNSPKIPAQTLKLLQFTHDSGHKDAQNEKKQKMSELKAKKLEKLRKKQQIFLQNQSLSKDAQEEKLLQKFRSSSKMQEQQMQQQRCCCICRGQLNQSSVFIVSLAIRNHEKLLKIGPGIECISINSCKHIFDYKCIEKMYRKTSNVNSVSCPLCKFQANMLFPVSRVYAKTIEQQVAKRVVQILNSISEDADFYEEVIKGFYHYALLCSVDLEFTIKKKSELYRTLLYILKNSIPENQIKKINQKVQSGEISKYFEKQLKQQKPLSLSQGPLAMLLNLLRNQNVEQDIQNQVISAFEKQESISEPKQFVKKISHKKQNKREHFSLFNEVISSVIDYLSENQKNTQKNKKALAEQIKMQIEKNEEHTFARECLESLTNDQFQFKNIKQSKLSQQKLHILKEMPQNYTNVGSIKKCSECQQISVDLIMCLLCDWQGCQKCEKGYARTHINSVHGQVGAVMQIQKGGAYYMVSGGKPIFAGFLYEDEWQNSLEKATNWDQFELNTKLYKQMQKRILIDDLPTRSAKPQNEMR